MPNMILGANEDVGTSHARDAQIRVIQQMRLGGVADRHVSVAHSGTPPFVPRLCTHLQQITLIF